MLRPVPYDEIVPISDYEHFRKQHKRQVGRVLQIITVGGDFSYIRVIPTITMGLVPYRIKDPLIWATVGWNHRQGNWFCCIHNLPGKLDPVGTRSVHKTLKSALRRARKVVNKYAPKPPSEWTVDLNIESIKDIYPSQLDYNLARDYWDSV